MDNEIRYFDYSSIRLFLKCPYMYYFRMMRHLVKTETPTALVFGKAWHAGMEAFHLGKYLKEMKEAFDESYGVNKNDQLRTRERGHKMLETYVDTYPLDKEPYKVLHAETPFKVPLTDNIVWCGKADAIVRWKNKMTYIKECKTATRAGASYANRFQLNYQIDSYVLGAEAIIGECAGALVDVAKVSTKITRDNFMRFTVGRSHEEIEVAKWNLIKIINHIIRTENFFKAKEKVENGEGNTLMWNGIETPYMNKESCFEFSGCPYYTICKSSLDERATRAFAKKKWNPEKGEEEDV